ncbi:UPF0149 family protein [Bacterioplanoides sp.]|uniref:UPF0149 family protein n=1 Tax=Bacterioplanoides sp. TaxID=2066072 RepID=UPI003B597967
MNIDFSDIADLWLESRCYQTPSALHGWLTGYLSAGARLTTENWLREAEDYLELDEAPQDKLKAALVDFYDQVLKGLSGEDMTYQPLLPPDDEADVVEQVDCLAEWSKGFLDGIGASGKLQGNKLAEDVTEVLRDLDAFSNATIEDPKDPDNEALYLELAEHARISALTVFYGMNQKPAVEMERKTLH